MPKVDIWIRNSLSKTSLWNTFLGCACGISSVAKITRLVPFQRWLFNAFLCESETSADRFALLQGNSSHALASINWSWDPPSKLHKHTQVSASRGCLSMPKSRPYRERSDRVMISSVSSYHSANPSALLPPGFTWLPLVIAVSLFQGAHLFVALMGDQKEKTHFGGPTFKKTHPYCGS